MTKLLGLFYDDCVLDEGGDRYVDRDGKRVEPSWPCSRSNPATCFDCGRRVYVADRREPAHEGKWVLFEEDVQPTDRMRNGGDGRWHAKCRCKMLDSLKQQELEKKAAAEAAPAEKRQRRASDEAREAGGARPPRERGTCGTCNKSIALTKAGKLQIHGPTKERCVGSGAEPIAADE